MLGQGYTLLRSAVTEPYLRYLFAPSLHTAAGAIYNMLVQWPDSQHWQDLPQTVSFLINVAVCMG